MIGQLSKDGDEELWLAVYQKMEMAWLWVAVLIGIEVARGEVAKEDVIGKVELREEQKMLGWKDELLVHCVRWGQMSFKDWVCAKIELLMSHVSLKTEFCAELGCVCCMVFGPEPSYNT